MMIVVVVQGYTANNLKGLSVGHDVDEFDNGESVILTLADHCMSVFVCELHTIDYALFILVVLFVAVLDDEDDVLQNIDKVEANKV